MRQIGRIVTQIGGISTHTSPGGGRQHSRIHKLVVTQWLINQRGLGFSFLVELLGELPLFLDLLVLGLGSFHFFFETRDEFFDFGLLDFIGDTIASFRVISSSNS